MIGSLLGVAKSQNRILETVSRSGFDEDAGFVRFRGLNFSSMLCARCCCFREGAACLLLDQSDGRWSSG